MILGTISDDTLIVKLVTNGQNRGLNIICGTVMTRDVSSIEVLNRDGDPLEFRHHDGLTDEMGIKW